MSALATDPRLVMTAPPARRCAKQATCYFSFSRASSAGLLRWNPLVRRRFWAAK